MAILSCFFFYFCHSSLLFRLEPKTLEPKSHLIEYQLTKILPVWAKLTLRILFLELFFPLSKNRIAGQAAAFLYSFRL